jgi:hypothetical protein
MIGLSAAVKQSLPIAALSKSIANMHNSVRQTSLSSSTRRDKRSSQCGRPNGCGQSRTSGVHDLISVSLISRIAVLHSVAMLTKIDDMRAEAVASDNSPSRKRQFCSTIVKLSSAVIALLFPQHENLAQDLYLGFVHS